MTAVAEFSHQAPPQRPSGSGGTRAERRDGEPSDPFSAIFARAGRTPTTSEESTSAEAQANDTEAQKPPSDAQASSEAEIDPEAGEAAREDEPVDRAPEGETEDDAQSVTPGSVEFAAAISEETRAPERAVTSTERPSPGAEAPSAARSRLQSDELSTEAAARHDPEARARREAAVSQPADAREAAPAPKDARAASSQTNPGSQPVGQAPSTASEARQPPPERPRATTRPAATDQADSETAQPRAARHVGEKGEHAAPDAELSAKESARTKSQQPAEAIQPRAASIAAASAAASEEQAGSDDRAERREGESRAERPHESPSAPRTEPKATTDPKPGAQALDPAPKPSAPQPAQPAQAAPEAPAQISMGRAPQPAQQTAQSSPTWTLDAQPEADAQSVQRQIDRGFAAALRQGGGGVTLRLSPASLGAVRIEMSVSGGAIEARLEANSPQARELLEQNIAALRSSLEARGFSVDRLHVQMTPSPTAPQSGSQQGEGQQQGAGQEGWRPSHGAGAGGEEQRGSSGAREDPANPRSGVERSVESDQEDPSRRAQDHAGQPLVHTTHRIRLDAIA